VESLVERQREIGEKERLNTTLTELIHATRYLESTDSFLTIFEKAVGQANAEPYLTGHQVRALDRAGFRRRHRRFNDAFLEQRLKLIDKLVNEVDESTENDTNLVKWATSWIMNATGLAISVGEISTAQRLLQQASEVTERFTNLVGRYGQTDQAWIKCRFLQLKARLSTQEKRNELLRRAETTAKRGLLISGGSEWWIEFYHRRVKHYLREVRSDDERTEAIDRTQVLLQDLFGEKDNWPFKARIHFAALVRDAADRDFNPSLQISHAQQAINTLLPIEDRLRRLARQGDTRSILVLSRAYDVLFRKHRDNEEEELAHEALNEAIPRVQTALEHKSTVTAWRLYLKLQDQKSDLQTLDKTEFERRGRPISDELYDAISDCEEWLEQRPEERGEGRLRLWCVERKWSEQGSLTRAMWDEQYNDLSRPEGNPQSWRRDIIRKIYLERRDVLEWIEREYGLFPKLYQELARLEFQYQRSKGYQGVAITWRAWTTFTMMLSIGGLKVSFSKRLMVSICATYGNLMKL